MLISAHRTGFQEGSPCSFLGTTVWVFDVGVGIGKEGIETKRLFGNHYYDHSLSNVISISSGKLIMEISACPAKCKSQRGKSKWHSQDKLEKDSLSGRRLRRALGLLNLNTSQRDLPDNDNAYFVTEQCHDFLYHTLEPKLLRQQNVSCGDRKQKLCQWIPRGNGEWHHFIS